MSEISITKEMFPDEYDSQELPEESILNGAKIYANRQTAEQIHLRKHGRVLEIGVASGIHAASLVKSLEPQTFHGVDVDLTQLEDSYKSFLEQYSATADIQFFQIESAKFLENQHSTSMPSYDVIYIDACHWHEFVKQELQLSASLVDIGGHIVLNDYQLWFPSSMEPCGVIKATNNFLATHPGWKVEYFAINDCDICLRRIA